jgi:hypothetical protein
MNTQVIWQRDPIVFGHRAPLIKCAVCQDMLEAEDFRPDLFTEELVEAMHEEHGPNVCKHCMDAEGRNYDFPHVEDEWL